MTDEVLNASIKVWKLLTEHIRDCRSPNCCVGILVDNLDNEKDNVGCNPRRTANRPTTGDYDIV